MESERTGKDSRVTCQHCNKLMIPRLQFMDRRPYQSFCPFCGEMHKSFIKEEKRGIVGRIFDWLMAGTFWLVVVVIVLVVIEMFFFFYRPSKPIKRAPVGAVDRVPNSSNGVLQTVDLGHQKLIRHNN